MPIVLGAVLAGPDDTDDATRCWSGSPGSGPSTGHDKRRVQPFGEYLPWRPFFRLFSDYADRAGTSCPATGAGAVDAAGIRVGIAICWEIAFDDLVADSVAAGAQVLAVPTNNATFGRSEMTYQQLAMSRVRAVEHGRAVARGDDERGQRHDRAGRHRQRHDQQFTPDVLVAATPLRATTTLADRLRGAPEWMLLASRTGRGRVGPHRDGRARDPWRAPTTGAGRARAGEDENG